MIVKCVVLGVHCIPKNDVVETFTDFCECKNKVYDSVYKNYRGRSFSAERVVSPRVRHTIRGTASQNESAVK